MSRKVVGSVVAASLSLACISQVQAAVVDNFDSYAAGSSLPSNGWSASAGGSIVYPDAGSGLVPPTYNPLEGTKSVYIYSGGTAGRGWGAASSAVADGSILSWRVKMEVNASSGQTWAFLSRNVGIGGGSTPGGIIIDHATDQIRLFGVSEANTGVLATHGVHYKFEMELDFTNDEFDAYYTDITNGGARTFLGTQSFTTDLVAATVAAEGGVIMGNFIGGTAAFWDDIQVNAVPEPASLGLVALGLGAVARRRSR